MAKKYDLLIIGAGPGGYTAAAKAARLGMRVGLIEKDRVGGVCVNRGCIPTKALLYAANLFEMMQHSDEFGVSMEAISFDFGKMQDYKRQAVTSYRKEVSEMLRSAGVDLITGTAMIRRERTVEVKGPDGKDFYEAKNIIIATGAEAHKPKIPGINLPGVLTSDQILEAGSWRFGRLVIIGGGVIGVEFATIFRSLFSQVTILEKHSHLLGPMDKEVSQRLEELLRDKGIHVYCDADVERIEEEDGLVCHATHGEEKLKLKASQILVATGRNPYIKGLLGPDTQLETEDGCLKVNGDFETSEPGVYAIGDVTGGIQLAYKAAAQGTYVVEKIAGIPHSVRLSVVPNGMFVNLPIVPNCIYTAPEIATVGITEEIAKSRQMKVRCGCCSMKNNGKSIISKENGGFIRLVFEAYTNTLVGAQMICPRATDMIAEMATAIANSLTAEQLSFAMRAHPTYSEAVGMAIEDAMNQEVQ